MIHESELLTYFILFGQIYRDKLGVIKMQLVDRCVKLPGLLPVRGGIFALVIHFDWVGFVRQILMLFMQFSVLRDSMVKLK